MSQSQHVRQRHFRLCAVPMPAKPGVPSMQSQSKTVHSVCMMLAFFSDCGSCTPKETQALGLQASQKKRKHLPTTELVRCNSSMNYILTSLEYLSAFLQVSACLVRLVLHKRKQKEGQKLSCQTRDREPGLSLPSCKQYEGNTKSPEKMASTVVRSRTSASQRTFRTSH